MSMKKTDLEKNKMMKMSNLMKVSGESDRFGKGAVVADRKEQRKIDQAAGLVPFACKLSSEMIKTLHAEAESKKLGMNELVAELITKGLSKKK